MPDGGRVHLTTDITAERRQRQERTLVATAMAQVGDSIEITDTDYRLLYVNPAFTALTGYTAEEALGRTPGRAVAQRSASTRVLRRDRPRIARRRGLEGPDRQPPQVRTAASTRTPPSRRSTTRPASSSISCCAKRDISDRIRAEAALEESRRTHAAVLEAALDCFISIDEDGRIIEFNPAAERTFGYTFAEVQRPGAPHAADAAGPARRPRRRREALSRDRRVAHLGPAARAHRDAQGRREIPVELVVAETRHEDRPAFMAYMRDLSEQKRTEAALRASEARFQAAAASMPDGLVILDPEDRIAFYNSRHPELLPPALREGLASRHPVRGLDPRRPRPRAGLPPRHGPGLCRRHG